ncbi:MAG: methyltransferase family protein [Alphaproteobacteria bacterium]
MEARQNSKTGIRVIPPVIFIVALAAAFLANWFWPIRLLPDAVRYSLGPVLVIASFAVVPSVLRAFKRANTPFDTRRAANALVTDGPFRYSRNPGYLAMIVLCVGIAVIADNAWVVVTLIAASVALHRYVVLAEERHLEARFGEEYRKYKSRVRRWL